MKAIDSFRGNYRFLSNFYPAEVKLGNQVCPTVEHAYQAAKTSDMSFRSLILKAATPGDAKRLGRKAILVDNWEKIKDEVMLNLLRQKFLISELRDALFRTGSAELIEGNTWNDTYWGVCNGVGQNKLGKALMQVREEITHDVPSVGD